MSNVAETAEQGNGVKHTPGPWLVKQSDYSNSVFHNVEADAAPWRIATIETAVGAGCGPDVLRAEANARLIAKAPELLATCIELRTALLMAMKAMASHPEAWEVFCALAERAGITDGLGKRSQEVIDAATGTTS